MKRLITAAIATSLMASAMPATAQTYRDQTYRNDTAQYSQDRGDYERQLREYEANRERYERDRNEYDRRYGSGSFERYYGGFRDERPAYDNRYGNDRYDPYSYYANSPCERRGRSNDRTGGTVIGALIGGALGAAAAGDSSQTEGAVLGAIVGGALGNNIAGNSRDDRYIAKCDSRGYYFTYDQTIPYRERSQGRSGRYDTNYYSRQRCRLAPAPADTYGRVEYRYVRVCPDRNNRYRITG